PVGRPANTCTASGAAERRAPGDGENGGCGGVPPGRARRAAGRRNAVTRVPPGGGRYTSSTNVSVTSPVTEFTSLYWLPPPLLMMWMFSLGVMMIWPVTVSKIMAPGAIRSSSLSMRKRVFFRGVGEAGGAASVFTGNSFQAVRGAAGAPTLTSGTPSDTRRPTDRDPPATTD